MSKSEATDKDTIQIGGKKLKWDNIFQAYVPADRFQQDVRNIVEASGSNILGPVKPSNWNQFTEDVSVRSGAEYEKMMKPIVTQALEEYDRQKKAQDNRWPNRLKRYTVNITSGLFWVIISIILAIVFGQSIAKLLGIR